MVVAIQTRSIRPAKFSRAIKIKHQLITPFQRLWWHLHAYTVIFGLMLLTGFSLIVLSLYGSLASFLFAIRATFYPAAAPIAKPANTTK